MTVKHISKTQVNRFQKKVYDFYSKHGREMPWRDTENRYHIYVSEIMLQQTQVDRVREPYRAFITRFPSFEVLARASEKQVLEAWQGLGYNRRALFAHRAARYIIQNHDGKLPTSYAELLALPGIGPATAGSLMAFAHNLPVVFIETNIRRVYIHHFFKENEIVSDNQLLPIIEATLDKEQPRIWYSALMDYGSELGKTTDNANRRSKHYIKQAPFEGSLRQARGRIIKLLLKKGNLSGTEICRSIGSEITLCQKALEKLRKEGMVQKKGNSYTL